LGVVGPTQSFVAAATCLCFAIIYFILAGEVFAGTDFKSLGWYCLPVSLTLLVFGLGFAHVLGTALALISQFAVLWIWWAALFFFLTFGLGKAGWQNLQGTLPSLQPFLQFSIHKQPSSISG